MFETIIRQQASSADEAILVAPDSVGKLTATQIRELPATEGFSIFKSATDRLKECRTETHQHIQALCEKKNKIYTEVRDEADGRRTTYLKAMAAVSQRIKGKSFNKDAFLALTFPWETYKYRIIQHALERMDDVKQCIVFAFAGDIHEAAMTRAERYDLHSKNDAYMSFSGFIDTPGDVLSWNELMPYYAVAADTKVTAAGYDENFVTHMLSIVPTVNAKIQATAYGTMLTQRIAKLTALVDTETEVKKIKLIPSEVEDTYYLVSGATRAVSSYLPDTVKLVHFIVDHCYK